MTEQSTIKTYPHKEEDIKYEKEIKDAIKKLPLEQRFQAIALNNYILMRKQLDGEVESQIQDIVRKFNKLQAPLMNQINEIVGGKRAPTDAEVGQAKEYLTAEEAGQVEANLNSEPISEYWFKVLTSCVKLSEDIFETDHALLKHVTQIETISEDEGEHFTIKFHFSPNEYIENEFLSVRFVMLDDQEFERTEGTEIKWKEGKDITKKTITKKQKNKKTGKTRSITKTVDADSFFNFFKTITPKGDAEDNDDEDEEGGDEDAEKLAINFNIALTLQEEIVPYHLEYYLGLRIGDEDMDDDDLGDIDEEDEDDEDDDEDEGPGHKHGKNCAHGHGKKGGKGAGAGAGAGAEGKQECKQQ